MKYREIEYQVLQTAVGWKWTVQLGNLKKTGSGFSRGHAIGLAQRAIDKALKDRTQPAEPHAIDRNKNASIAAKYLPEAGDKPA
jgi:hypothetical protein